MQILNRILILMLLLSGTPLLAEPLPEKATIPPPPVIPDEASGQQQIQADVVIRKSKDKVVEEYRINGALYMVKVTPRVGKPYYIRYPDGESGRAIRHELRDINTPYWKLFEW